MSTDPDVALCELREALDEAGIVLPSLGMEPTGFLGWNVDHINLGGCNSNTALRLARVIRQGARSE